MKKVSILIAALALLGAACGSNGGSNASSSGGGRTIKVTMTDNKYQPSSVEVTKGETVRFVFTNDGKVDHEALVGDAKAQTDHEKEMSNMGGGMNHGSSDVLTVKPGKTASLTHTFDKAGGLLIGCHEKGHYVGGMKLSVNVS